MQPVKVSADVDNSDFPQQAIMRCVVVCFFRDFNCW